MKDSTDSSHELIIQAKQILREVALDFGMDFERDCRRRIEILMQALREQRETSGEPGKSKRRARVITTLLQNEVHHLVANVSDQNLRGLEWGFTWQGGNLCGSGDWDNESDWDNDPP